MSHNDDLIRRIDAMQATQVGPSDEWAKATKSGYNQAATDIAMNIMKLPAATLTVQVKPLVWEKHRDYGLHDAPSPLGWWYNIHETSGSRFEYQGDPAAGREGNPKMFTTIEAAKAAAQADYAARIMAALDVTAPDVAQIRADALLNAIRWAHDTLWEINPENYSHEEVCKLNDASVDVILGLAVILGEKHGKSDEWWQSRAALAP